MVTIPVPMLMSQDFWYSPRRQPDRAVMALATHRPTIMVREGVDGGGLHHVLIVTGGLDGEPQTGVEEEGQQDRNHPHEEYRHDEPGTSPSRGLP